MTPFGGLRVLARSGQRLLGQSEELEKLLAKIFHDEIKNGKVIKIQDDIIIGGATQLEAARNYILVLEKLHLANLRVEPNKTLIFPSQDGSVMKEAISLYLHTEEAHLLTQMWQTLQK